MTYKLVKIVFIITFCIINQILTVFKTKELKIRPYSPNKAESLGNLSLSQNEKSIVVEVNVSFLN